eukprot:TRINITY_DN6714_c0_g1_i1.p1 TRINITY_DN6714_c0_g1~~TRINITY_DN6714_c0_g1_i1.p1  ORF type:complete len:541 (-),score=92.99 TRINITY_DN6714_c0_g1_i1:227-1828(-)
MARSALLLLLLCSVVLINALNNGLGRTPQMGYNSWYDVQMNPTQEVIEQTVQALKSTGLYDLGFRYVNLDDGMVSGRNAQGELQSNPAQFPTGMKGLADYIHQNGMLFGVYTDRGPLTCGGRPAAQGHERQDANTYAQWGVDYVKEDSCNAPSDHQQAFYQYSLMRDALNATGRSIFFSLCGWEDWYAPVGHDLGNSWRTGPDDTNWAGVLKNIDIMAPLWPFAGPGGWNDPCLLLGRDSKGVEAVTDLQGRAQFSMWAIMASPMLLSQNVRNLSDYQLETYRNKEVIEIGQDPLGRSGQRLVGGQLSSGSGSDTPVTLQSCNAGDTTQQWQWNVTSQGFVTNVNDKQCINADDCGDQLIMYDCVTSGGTCMGPRDYSNEQFYLSADGTLRSAMPGDLCVTSFGVGAQLSLHPCTGSGNQLFGYDTTSQTIRDTSGRCVTAGGASGATRANIWGRPLIDGSWAFTFINANSTQVELVCDQDCFAATGWEPEQLLRLRDVWNHEELGKVTPREGFKALLEADGGAAMYRAWPVW